MPFLKSQIPAGQRTHCVLVPKELLGKQLKNRGRQIFFNNLLKADHDCGLHLDCVDIPCVVDEVLLVPGSVQRISVVV